MSHDVGRAPFRISVGGRGQVQEANASPRARIHKPPDGLDRNADKQPGPVPVHVGPALPEEFHEPLQQDSGETPQGVRARLHTPLSERRGDSGGEYGRIK